MKAYRNQRLRDVLDYLKSVNKVRNQTHLGMLLSVNRSQICEYLSGRRDISDKFVHKLVSVFPEIDMNYLLDEQSTQMIKKTTEPQQPEVVPAPSQMAVDVVALLRIIEKQQEQIDRLLTAFENKQQ